MTVWREDTSGTGWPTPKGLRRGRDCPLLWGLDQLEWDGSDLDRLTAAICEEQPVWLRIANFFVRNVELLRRLPPGQLVLWKLEHWGEDTTYDRVPASPGVDVAALAVGMLSLPHHVVPYTFADRNVELLRREAPVLRSRRIAVVPIAAKTPIAVNRRAVRSALGIDEPATLLGVAGLDHPAKGIDDVVVGFLRDVDDPAVHLLVSVVSDDVELVVERLVDRWVVTAGRSSPRLHVRVGRYGEWEWMSAFYRSVDVVLVNSVSESWCRMVSEPMSLGVPVVVRAARCASNDLAPDLTIVDSVADLSSEGFRARGRTCQARCAAARRVLDRTLRLTCGARPAAEATARRDTWSAPGSVRSCRSAIDPTVRSGRADLLLSVRSGLLKDVVQLQSPGPADDLVLVRHLPVAE